MESVREQLSKLSPEELIKLMQESGHIDLISKEKSAQKKKEEGNQYFRTGSFIDAIVAYSECIKLEPNNAVYYSNRAAAYLKTGEFQKAIEDCTASIRISSSVKALLRRGTSYLSLSMLSEATDDFLLALDHEPNNKEGFLKVDQIIQLTVHDSNLIRVRLKAILATAFRIGWQSLPMKGNPAPLPVNGARLVRVPRNNTVFLYGGRAVRDQKSEVYMLNDNDNSWDVVQLKGDPPNPRAWHSMCMLDASRAFVYGGVSAHGEDYRAYILDFVRQTWHEALPSQDSDVPAGRSGHACERIEHVSTPTMYVFGGRTRSGVSDSMYLIEEETENCIRWTRIEKQIGQRWPSARDGHTMNLVDKRLVLFGGNGQKNEEKLNDVWIFDLSQHQWEQVLCTGDIPAPRSYHSAHPVGNRFLFLIGGRSIHAEDGRVYMLDVIDAHWYKVKFRNNNVLKPRAWHSSVFTSQGRLIVIGGGSKDGPHKNGAWLDFSNFISCTC